MPDHASIPRRLNSIKRLARNYFVLEKGALIEKHLEKLRVFDIRGSKYSDHPQKMRRVYISRRALKHVVESRKEELVKNHSENEALEILCFAIDRIQETITDFDTYELTPPTHTFMKDYARDGKPLLRIMLEMVEGRFEIKSIHFRKRK